MHKLKQNLEILNKLYFISCLLFIAAVSSIDTGITVKFKDVLQHTEENPLARFILSIHNWEVAGFVSIKMFLTILVLGILISLYHIKPKHAMIITVIVAMFQAVLLSYLLFY